MKNHGPRQTRFTLDKATPETLDIDFEAVGLKPPVTVDLTTKCGVTWNGNHFPNLKPVVTGLETYVVTVQSTPTRKHGLLARILRCFRHRHGSPTPPGPGGDDITTTITDSSPSPQKDTQTTAATYT